MTSLSYTGIGLGLRRCLHDGHLRVAVGASTPRGRPPALLLPTSAGMVGGEQEPFRYGWIFHVGAVYGAVQDGTAGVRTH